MNVKAVGIACLCAMPVICLLSLLGLSMVNSNSGSGNLTFNETSDVGIQNTQIAADFSIVLVSGEEYQLSDSDSKITIIDFWSSWCIPCVEEAPMLQKFYLDHQDLGVDMLGIAIWDTAVSVNEHIDRFGVTYANALDEDGLIAIDYGVRGIPEKHFIAAGGRVLHKISGPVDETRLKELVGELMESIVTD